MTFILLILFALVLYHGQLKGPLIAAVIAAGCLLIFIVLLMFFIKLTFTIVGAAAISCLIYAYYLFFARPIK